MGARQDVDGIDLHEAETLEHALEMSGAGPPRPVSVKALRRQGDPARLAARQPLGLQTVRLGCVDAARRSSPRRLMPTD